MVRALIVGLVVLGSGCSDRSLAAGSDDDSDGACVEIGCPCNSHSDCAPGSTCLDARCSPTCGDGVVDPGEQCDAIEPACNSFCLVPGGLMTRLDTPLAGARDIEIAPDGTLALVGFGVPDGANGWIARMDVFGAVLWEREIEASTNAWPYAVAVADDGDVIATGAAQSHGAWIHRYSPAGELRWERHYGRDTGEPALGMAVAVADDDVLALIMVWNPEQYLRTEAIRLDGRGDELWRLDVDPVGGLHDTWSIVVDGAGDAWIAGRIGDASTVFLGRIPSGTAMLEPHLIDPTLQEFASGLGFTADGSIVVAGSDSTRGWVTARARDGTATWEWSSETPFHIYDLAVDPTGHVVIVGLASQRGFVTKLRPDGTTAWTFVPPDGADGSFVDSYHALAIDDDGFVYALALTGTPTGAITKLAP